MKKLFIVFLFFISLINLEAAFSKTNKSHSASSKIYSFNFGSIQIRESKLSKKSSGRRKFQGVLRNKTPNNYEWISFKFYFKDPEYNNGRYTLVSEEVVRNIPKKADKLFKLYIPVEVIDGRNFKVEIGSRKKGY